MLEIEGENDGKSGLHVVNSFMKSHQSNHMNKCNGKHIPPSTF